MSRKERGNPLLKLLDCGVGIPLLFLLSLCKWGKKRAPSLAAAREIALFKSAAIGDTVILSAIVGDIRRANGSARVTVITGSSNYEAARLIPGVDRVIMVPVTRPLEAIRILRQAGRFDVWIDFGSWPRLDALLSWGARSGFCAGFKTRGQYRHYLYDLAVEHRNDVHELENYRNLVAPLGVAPAGLPELRRRDVTPDPRLAVLHMFPGGARSYMKEWPEERWAELAAALCAQGYRVVLTGTGADRGRAEALADRISPLQVASSAGKLTLEQTVDLLASAALVVSVNTGVMHLASAQGCNLVSLNGPTSVRRWGPLNANSVSLTPALQCAPCINLGFEYGCDSNDCMRDISTAAVLEAVRSLTPEQAEGR